MNKGRIGSLLTLVVAQNQAQNQYIIFIISTEFLPEYSDKSCILLIFNHINNMFGCILFIQMFSKLSKRFEPLFRLSASNIFNQRCHSISMAFLQLHKLQYVFLLLDALFVTDRMLFNSHPLFLIIVILPFPHIILISIYLSSTS
ncbi:hypothetical protein KIL84_023202 [Mauremys mutica]|uniref:Transmembrane protein n=1 Tax=Mauremys mutica TaxID=74926 RepID=A0A9D4APE2_9SAUR|nr:hypothetical protein KIL84_023202 [Mauremys mutica]